MGKNVRTVLVFICIALFWISSLGILFAAAIDSSKGFLYWFLKDFLFQILTLVGFLGVFSLFLARFYRNIHIEYFMFCFFGLSCWFFLGITSQMLGFDKAHPKAEVRTFDWLVFHYCINAIFCSLSVLGIYALFAKYKKIATLCFASAMLHFCLMFFLMYGFINWGEPMEEYKAGKISKNEKYK